MALRCLFSVHRWRPITNDAGLKCDYCSLCCSELHRSGSRAADPLVARHPSPSWFARHSAVSLGRRTALPSTTPLYRLADHLELGRWLRAHGLDPGKGLGGREDVQDVAMALSAGSRLLYLEFGVYRGQSMRRWSQGVPNELARFVGFDSFEGLPEDWRPEVARGHFDLGGNMPFIDDARVQLVPGWFEDTVPLFDPPEHDLMIVNIDCDLYNSARVALLGIATHVRAGTLLYFDEFSDPRGEMRAFEEFLQMTDCQVEVVARARNWSHWLFRVEALRDRPRGRRLPSQGY